MNFSANHPRSPATPPAASRTLLLATDLQQSILAELDRSGPNRLAYSAYGAYGVPSSQRPPGSRLGFNGQLRERSTGWYHLGNGHRVYNPVLMRFHSPDRLSPFEKGGINPYAYCQGDPINFTDPTGRYLRAAADVAISAFTKALEISVAYQRSWSAALNLELLANAFTVAPAVGGTLRSFQVSVAGAALNFTGAAMQLAGVASGSFVANAGITLSTAGIGYRVFSAGRELYRKGELWKRVKDNFWNMLGSPPPPRTSTTAAPTSPPAPATRDLPLQQTSIEMDGLSRTSAGAAPASDFILRRRAEDIRIGG